MVFWRINAVAEVDLQSVFKQLLRIVDPTKGEFPIDTAGVSLNSLVLVALFSLY